MLSFVKKTKTQQKKKKKKKKKLKKNKQKKQTKKTKKNKKKQNAKITFLQIVSRTQFSLRLYCMEGHHDVKNMTPCKTLENVSSHMQKFVFSEVYQSL